MMRQVDGRFADATAAVVSALEHQRDGRSPLALLVVELVCDPDGTRSWLQHRVVSSQLAVTPSELLREVAQLLEQAAAAAEAEAHIQ